MPYQLLINQENRQFHRQWGSSRKCLNGSGKIFKGSFKVTIDTQEELQYFSAVTVLNYCLKVDSLLQILMLMEMLPQCLQLLQLSSAKSKQSTFQMQTNFDLRGGSEFFTFFPNSNNRNMTMIFMIYGTDIGEIYATFGSYMAFI